jgi:hypothetical protein
LKLSFDAIICGDLFGEIMRFDELVWGPP